MRSTVRTALVLLSATAMAAVLALSTGSGAGASLRKAAPATHAYPLLHASILRTKGGTETMRSSFKSLPVPSHDAARPFYASSVKMPTNLFLHRVSASQAILAGTRTRSPHASVLIKGTFAVTGVPASSSVVVIVVACPGGTTYGFFCGTQTSPAFEASVNFAKGSNSSGTFDFGGLPTMSAGWQLGIILLDGELNGGYYPASTPVTVAKGGSSATVTAKLSMAFVAPEALSTLGINGAPKGYAYFYNVVACPSSVTADQLGLYESFGGCAIAFGQTHQQLGLYLAPGSWTVRYYYEPSQHNVEMAASSSVILKDFDIVGPTITVASLGSSQLVTVTAPYIAPSVTGTDVSKLTSRVFAAELAFVDLSTNTFEAGVFVNPNANAKTSFDVFLDPGTYVPYSEVLPPSNTGFVAAASFIQVLLRQAGPNVTVAAHGPPVATSYTVAPFTASILGGFAIGGLDDPSGVYGEDNAIPFTYVIDCPASETFSLECANAIYLSPSELLGGRFTLYGLTGASRLAFTYTTLDGTVIIGPTVTAPASSTPQAVTLTAPYSNPKMWGSITLTGDTNGQLLAMWTQACPASEPFSIGCANGVSDTVASFGLLFFGGSSVSLGYGMDLPHGAWKIAAVGTTDPNFATTQQLGPPKSIIVGGVYPVLNLSASV